MSTVQSGSEPTLGFFARLEDRLNPILVREINQAVGGRAFTGMLHASVAAVCLLCIVFFGAARVSGSTGAQLLSGCILCVSPLILIFVPMQAFSSMRAEVTGGTAEQLLMTRLRPLRIVSGKLGASLLQFVLYLSIFAPLVAVTYLLNGVDFAQILLLLYVALLLAVTATAFAVAMGTISGGRQLQQLIQGVTASALFGLAFTVMGASFMLPYQLGNMLRGGDFWSVLGAITAVFLSVMMLCCIVASTSLAHAYENRSTPFRAFAIGFQLLSIPWMLLTLRTSDLDDVPAYLSMGMAGFGAPFWLYAACEERELSPRVRTLVPRRKTLAFLSTPFLPGGQRGVVFAALMVGIGIMIPFATAWLGGVTPRWNLVEQSNLAWAYVGLYAVVGRLVRARMRPGRARSVLAMTIVALGAGLVWAAAYVVDLMFDNHIRWHLLHLPDPFLTIDQSRSLGGELGIVIAVTVGIGALGFLANVRGAFREVGEASAARRKLAG